LFCKACIGNMGAVSGVSASLWDRWAGSVIVVIGLSLQVRRDGVPNVFIENTIDLRTVCSVI
jgi:hypothetical protein